jgi:hypothetical protein
LPTVSGLAIDRLARWPLPLLNPGQRVAAIEVLAAIQHHYSADEWSTLVDRLSAALGWDGAVRDVRMMSWEQVRELHRSGLVTIGGHSVSHPILECCSPAQARAEIFECMEAIRGRLDQVSPPFAYPHGACPAPEIEELTRGAGFACAFTGRNLPNTSRSPLFRLGRRHIAPGDVPMASFALSGLRPAAWYQGDRKGPARPSAEVGSVAQVIGHEPN